MRRKTEHSDIHDDLRSDFRVGEHVTDTSPSHAEKRRPAVTADKPKGQIHSCRENIAVTTAEQKDATHGAGRLTERNRDNTYICQVRMRRETCTGRTGQMRRDRRYCAHRFLTLGPRQAGRGPDPTRRDSRREWQLPCSHGTVLLQAPPRMLPVVGDSKAPYLRKKKSHETEPRTMDEAQVTHIDAVEMQITASHRRTRVSSCGFSAGSRKTS